MFIQTETTPNPATLKFIPGEPVMGSGAANFTSASDTSRSPLAEVIFKINGVEAVYLGGDFISVTKSAAQNWDTLKVELLTTIMEHYVAGRPVVLEEGAKEAEKSDDSDIVTQIKEIIETRVRPAVAQDGGDIIFHSFENGILKLEMHGSCSGCPSSSVTLKNGIENMMKHYIPEVESVEAV